MKRQCEQGSALLTVLLLIGVIGGMAALALDRLRTSMHVVTNGVALDQARAFALAGGVRARSLWRAVGTAGRPVFRCPVASRRCRSAMAETASISTAWRRVTSVRACRFVPPV